MSVLNFGIAAFRSGNLVSPFARNALFLSVSFTHQGPDGLAQSLISVIDEELFRLGLGGSWWRGGLRAPDHREDRKHQRGDSKEHG